MSDVCEYCGAYGMDHDYQHLARECYPLQLISLRERNAKLVAALVEVDHFLSAYGGMNRDTPLHLKICNALIENEEKP